MSDRIDIKTPVTVYGVLWKVKPTTLDTVEPGWTEYSGYWYDDVAPALRELDRAAVHPRCEEARMFTKKITYTELTENAVEWMEEKKE